MEIDRSHPLITVIRPVYNSLDCLERGVASVCMQTWENLEILLVDDGSTDGTPQVVRDAFHMEPISRPIHRQVPCQAVEAVFESRDCKVPVTLICKKTAARRTR